MHCSKHYNRQGFLIIEFLRNQGYVTIYEGEEIAMFGCEFSAASFSAELYNYFDIQLPDSLARAVASRQAEFLAGRFCARSALRKVCGDVESVPIGPHRSPVWPVGVVASISHTRSSAVCVAGSKDNLKYLGVDIAAWMTQSVAQEVSDKVVNPAEAALLATLGCSFERALTLAFSAKESLFKALYPDVGSYFGFEAAEITSVSLSAGSFELTLTQNLASELSAGASFAGVFSIEASAIRTLLFVTQQ